MPIINKWTPTTDLLTLRRMGKLVEELGELQSVAARVVIQGIDEIDPGSGKVNRARLQDELADVQAQIGCTVLAFGLDQEYIARRTAEKIRQMAEWEDLFADSVTLCPGPNNGCAAVCDQHPGCMFKAAVGVPASSVTDQRAAFEAWHTGKYGRAYSEWVEAKGRYAWDLTEELWTAWKAARALGVKEDAK